MRYSVHLGFRLPGGGSDLRDVRQLATAAETLGFHALWVGDHVVAPATFDQTTHVRDVGGESTIRADSNILEPLTTLAYLAAATDRIRLGTSVLVVPYRNPVLTAKMLAMIDVLSAGRLTVGVGAGWLREELDALGAESFALRGSLTDEYVELFREFWTELVVTHHGTHYDVSNIGLMPKPVQRPHPPIWFGGNGTAAMKRAARSGDGWFPLFRTPSQMRNDVVALRALLTAAGRQASEVTVAVAGHFRFAAASSSVERLPLTGTSDEMIEDIRAYREAGVDEVALLEPEGYASVSELTGAWERFTEEVARRA